MLNFFIFIRATLRNFYYFINFTFLIFWSFNFTFTESLKGFEMKPIWVFSDSPRDKNFRGFPSVKNHWWFKLEETFSGFLIQSARQDLYQFSLRVNHLWFKLEKKPSLCTTVLHHWGIQASFDKRLQESQWILHHLAELH